MGNFSATPEELSQFNETNAAAAPAVGSPSAFSGLWSALAIQVPRAAAEVNLAGRRLMSGVDTAISERLPGASLDRQAALRNLGAISSSETLLSLREQLAARRDRRYGVPEAVDQLNRIQTDPDTTGWAASAVGDIVGTVAKYGLAARAGTTGPVAEGDAASLTARALELVNQQRKAGPLLTMAAVNHTLMSASNVAELVRQGVPLDVAQRMQSENNLLQDAFLLAPGGGKTALTGALTAGGIAFGMDSATRHVAADQLDHAGFHELADQYRQFDAQGTIVSAIVFAALGAHGGHINALEEAAALARKQGADALARELEHQQAMAEEDRVFQQMLMAEQMAGGQKTTLTPEESAPLPGETPEQTQSRVQAAQAALDEAVKERTTLASRISEIDTARQNDIALLGLARSDAASDQSQPRQQAAREALAAQGRWEAGQQEAARQFQGESDAIKAQWGSQIRDKVDQIRQIILSEIHKLQAKAALTTEGFDQATAIRLRDMMGARHDDATLIAYALRQIPNQARSFEVAQMHRIATEIQPLQERMADELRQAHDRVAREQVIPRLEPYRAALARYRQTLTSERAPLVRRASLALANDPRLRAELKAAQEALDAQQNEAVPTQALDAALTLIDQQHALESAMPGAPKTADAHEAAIAAGHLATDQAWHDDPITAEVPEHDYTQTRTPEQHAQEHADAAAGIDDALRDVGIEPLTEAEAKKLMKKAAAGKISPFEAERLARHQQIANPEDEPSSVVLTAREARRLYNAALKARAEGKPTPLEKDLERAARVETPAIEPGAASEKYESLLDQHAREGTPAPTPEGGIEPVNKQLEDAQRQVDAAKEMEPAFKAAGECAGDRA